MMRVKRSMSVNSGSNLWEQAKKIIPGGNMLLSKRAEMFLPGKWPAYFDSASGCTVKDLDGNTYTDFSIMGIGTNSLGYGHPAVDSAVKEVIAKGNMSTLNCPEEVWLAEELVSSHPWADMARFARSGGEANAIAVRIARAASGKDKIAFCGYHGWHDWYLAANIAEDQALDGHLLPGLEPKGVPRHLSNSACVFEYNDLEGLKALMASGEIGVIKMEVQRNKGPAEGFLLGVRQLADKYGAVLIFDECTSGFRETYGGLHKKFGVHPDLAVFGKALGNGYAISAVIGRKEVMDNAQSTFISSTFWTERIGPAAALATLRVMREEKSWDVISEVGVKIRQAWSEAADRQDIKIRISGIPSIQSYAFASDNNLEYKTFVTQEMLKKGFLSTPLIYASMAHTDGLISLYSEALENCFAEIRVFENGAASVLDALEGPVCHSGFKRLN